MEASCVGDGDNIDVAPLVKEASSELRFCFKCSSARAPFFSIDIAPGMVYMLLSRHGNLHDEKKAHAVNGKGKGPEIACNLRACLPSGETDVISLAIVQFGFPQTVKKSDLLLEHITPTVV